MGKVRKTEVEKTWGRDKVMSNVKRAAIYVRVSTAEQETDLQEHELKEYCERRGWSWVVTGIKVRVERRMTDQL